MEGRRMGYLVVILDSVIVTILLTIGLIFFNSPKNITRWFIDKELNEFEKTKLRSYTETILAILGATLIIFALFHTLMNLVLFFGLRQRSESKIKTWYISNLILTLIIVIETVYITVSWRFSEAFLTKILPNLVFLVYRFFSLWVIRDLLKKMRRRQHERMVDALNYTHKLLGDEDGK